MSGPSPIRHVPKPWGHETIWAATDHYVGKILHINAGEALSVQYHKVKDETVYLLSGTLRYRIWENDAPRDVPLGVGDAFRVTPGTIHQMEAVTDCDVLEVSTPNLDDVVRVTDRYGRQGDERAMKVIIPLAGKGTRLRPHTHVTPKPMLKVAGKPVIDYVMEDLERLGNVEQVVYITGHLKERVESYVRERSPFSSVFIEQQVQDGTAGAVALARPHVDQPVFIIFVDTIFDADLSIVNRVDADGIIWVKEVDDYQRFGVVVADESGNMTRIVEKPSEPVSRRANIGLYYIRNWKLLYEGIDWVLKQPKQKGEYYLTDAFQYMIDHGARIRVEDVRGWYDAGEKGTLLETNQVMLTKGRARRPDVVPDGVTIVDPVCIGDQVTLRSSTIGPNVTIGDGTVIESSTVRDSVIGDGARIVRSKLASSLIANGALVSGVSGTVNVGDHSAVEAS